MNKDYTPGEIEQFLAGNSEDDRLSFRICRQLADAQRDIRCLALMLDEVGIPEGEDALKRANVALSELEKVRKQLAERDAEIERLKQTEATNYHGALAEIDELVKVIYRLDQQNKFIRWNFPKECAKLDKEPKP